MIKFNTMKRKICSRFLKTVLVSLVLLIMAGAAALAAVRVLMESSPAAAVSDLEVSDFDLDGVGEVAAAGPDRRVYLYENNGALVYTGNQVAGTTFLQLLSAAPQVGSPDGVILITDSQIAFFNLSARSVSPVWTSSMRSRWVFVGPSDVGDLNGDGLFDFAGGRYTAATNGLRVFVNRVVNGTEIAETGNISGNLDAVILENLGNSIYDTLVFSSTAPSFYIYNFNPQTGGLSKAAGIALGSRYAFLAAVSDANGDGTKDIACATLISEGNNGLDLRSGADGSLISSIRVSGAAPPVSLAAADFDADGISEVVVGTGGTDTRIRVYKAADPITLLWESELLEGNVYVRTGDFDYDGRADIVAASGSTIRLITYDSGNFAVAETTTAISGTIDLFEKFKSRQFNGGQAEDVTFANSINSQLKAITFFTPPVSKITVSNEKVSTTEISAGANYLLDRIYFTANYDGVLNSVSYTYSGNLDPVYLTSFKLFKDNGNRRFEPESDTLLGTTNIQSGRVVFNPNLFFASDAVNLLFLACDVRDDVPSGYTFKLSIDSPQDFYAQNFETTGSFPLETSTFLTVDKNTPVVYIQPSILEPDGNNGWYRSSVIIELSMNKLGLIYYRWNDDPKFYVYNGSLTPEHGENTLYVYGVDLYGNRSTTKTLTIKVDLTPPEPVRGLEAEQTGPDQVTLAWKPSLDKQPGSGMEKYEIYRNGVLIASVAANQTSYVDYSIKPLTTYKYKVRAVDRAGNAGSFSEEAAVKTKPAPIEITGLNVIEGTSANIILWDPVTTAAAGFINVYRSAPGAARDFTRVNDQPIQPGAGIFSDNLTQSVPAVYYYKLKLYSEQGDLLYETEPVSPEIYRIEKSIGTGGGTLSGFSGRVKLEVPAGALLSETTLTAKSFAGSLPGGTVALSSLLEFEPGGLTFASPATLTLSFKTNWRLLKDLIRIGYYDGQDWTLLLPDVVDTTAGVAKIKIDHFSVFGVVYLGTEEDLDPPTVETVRSASPSKVFVTFSEFIDSSSVSSASFTISETSVTTFYPYKDGKTVVVETTYMSPDRVYELYVSGIRDLAGNLIPEDGVSNTATFTVEPSPHGRYLDDTNKCSLCHSVHYGKNEQLLVKKTATEVCYICHDIAGSGSKYNTQSWFEDPETTSTHHTRFGDAGIYCVDCHTPHRDAAERASLLKDFSADSTETTPPPENFCFHCHGVSQTTLPAYLVIKEASYTAGIHYEALPGPSSGNGITCLQCHLPHASVQPTLMRGGTEESACISCHKNEGVSPESGIRIDAPDVLTSLLTAPDATVGLPGFPSDRVIWYKHPIIEYSGRHTLMELYDATLAAQSQSTTETRHAECEDCHNSHYARRTIYRNPPYVPGSVIGAAGVKVFYPDEDTTPVFVWEPYGSVTYEYEVCLRCHSSFAKAWYGDDLARLFSPYNTSYHPVIAVGKNQTAAIENSLIGLTPQSQILCSDCHFAADPTYPRGPHGSIYPFILSANYRFELKPRSTTDDYSSDDFELCFKCHSEEPFKDASGASRPDTNFRWHGYHLRMLYNNPGGNTVGGGILTPGAGQGNAICRECHYNQHGSSNSRLVTFSPNVLPTGTRTEPVFVPKTETSNGYCLLRCHGRGHGAGMSY